MNSHSKTWLKKRESLREKEETLKDELEVVTDLFEGRAKMILIISLATGGLFLIFYLITNVFGSKDEPEKKQKYKDKKKKKSNIGSNVFGSLLAERLINAGIKYVEQQVEQKRKAKK